MKVLKLFCVVVKSDIGKALWVVWLVGWFVLKRILIFAQFVKTKHLFVESLCIDYYYSDG